MNVTYTLEQIRISIIDQLAKDKANDGEAAVRARYARWGRPVPQQDLRYLVTADNGEMQTAIVFPTGWKGSAQQMLAIINRTGEDTVKAIGREDLL